MFPSALIARQIGFLLIALAPVFGLAAKIDFHSPQAILVGLGAIAASIGSSLTNPPIAPPKV